MRLDAVKEEIRWQYDRFASRYDRFEGTAMALLGVSRLRRRFLSRARGAVLEIAIGTGASLSGYAEDVQLTGVDLSSGMLKRARRRAEKLGRAADLRVMDAEALEFPDASYDTVVSSLALCTYPNPVAALREMSRVCRDDGRVLLFEHGRSRYGWLARWQDRRGIPGGRSLGCHWNRDPVSLVAEAGLEIRSVERRLLGMVYIIEAAPRRDASS